MATVLYGIYMAVLMMTISLSMVACLLCIAVVPTIILEEMENYDPLDTSDQDYDAESSDEEMGLLDATLF